MKHQDMKECRLTLASLAGAVSRWCALTGNVPDLNPGASKIEAELDAFAKHLDYLAAKKRRCTKLQF